jgi:ubiquinone biosynthesis protein COQ9
MIAPPERSPGRDAALRALPAEVVSLGWTMAALRRALRASGGDPREAELLFPGGTADLLEAWIDLEDRQMAAAMAARDLAALRLPQRVRLAIALRLQAARPHRAAVRRALAELARPRHARLAARTLARTVDAIWHAAGDRSADFAWYTKRLILGAIYSATLLVWLRDDSADDARTLAFLDRRLADHARFHKAQRRCGERLSRCLPGEAEPA